MDTKKDFDVVNHRLLLQNIFLDGKAGPDWLLLKNMYKDMETALSKTVEIQQRVRHGGLLSMEHWTCYNDPLLIDLEEKFREPRIGNISSHYMC